MGRIIAACTRFCNEFSRHFPRLKAKWPGMIYIFVSQVVVAEQHCVLVFVAFSSFNITISKKKL